MEPHGDPHYDHCVDASGLRCPEPVMLLHNGLRKMAVGEVVKLIATDPATPRDVVRLCRYLGHELVAEYSDAGVYRCFIRRG